MSTVWLRYSVVSLVLFAFASRARAGGDPVPPDTLDGTRGLVKEARHEIAVTMHRGYAVLTVRRTLWNWGQRHDQGVYMLSMPDWTVATGLRSRGLVDGKPVWFAGELMEAEAAAAKYRKLTGHGGYYPKDPALLSWRNASLLSLQVFPLAPGQGKTVEYTLTMATRYHDGRDVLELPRLGLPCQSPELILRAADARDSLWVDGHPLAANARMPWPRKTDTDDGDDGSPTHDQSSSDGAESTSESPDDRVAPPIGEPVCAEDGADRLTIELRRGAMPTLGGRLAVQPFAKNRVLVHYQVETPAELAPVPRRPAIVVLLDDSRSMAEPDQWAAAAAMRQVLGRMPDARVAILAFSRHVRPVTKGFVPATSAIAALAGYAYRRDNGSAVDEALAKADALLAAQPNDVRRVYLVSDLATREALDPLRLRGACRRSHAVVHIATLAEGTPALAPEEESPWSKVARATGGLAWTGSADAASRQRAELARVFEEWVRPTRLYHWHMDSPRLELEDGELAEQDAAGDSEARDALEAGTAIARLGVAESTVPSLKLRGELWSRRVSATLRPDAARARVWSALVFRASFASQLAEDEMMVLAKRGGAVSPVTSYLAIEPGVRPSTEGLEEGEGGLGLSGIGSGGGGTGCGVGYGGLGARSFDPQKYLDELVAKAWAACGGGQQAASLTVENTRDEVVDVLAVRAPTAKLAHCLGEAAWAFDLDGAFSRFPQQRWAVQVKH